MIVQSRRHMQLCMMCYLPCDSLRLLEQDVWSHEKLSAISEQFADELYVKVSAL